MPGIWRGIPVPLKREDNIMTEFEKDLQNGGGNLMKTLRLSAIVQITYLIEKERYDDACKVAQAVHTIASI